MLKKIILIAVLGVLIILSGCSGEVHRKDEAHAIIPEVSDAEEENITKKETLNEDNAAKPSLGGISLGDSLEKVLDVLGDDYEKTDETDSTGMIGEDTTVLTYESGIVITVGNNSKKVLRIVSASEDFRTDKGIKVGDTAKTVTEVYEIEFEKAVSRQTNELLEGWYLIGDEAVIIFDYDKTNYTVMNFDIKPDSKVEEIILAYWRHFD